ncbi:MAG: hypothetical protein II867_03385, partial [Clostridia bacterium]|nr:hypothetical protein [Clostridia bacterium]
MKHAQKIILNISTVLIAVCILFACVGCSKQEALPIAIVNAPEQDLVVSTPHLCNTNATADTVALYNYILSTYKTKIISGQQETTGNNRDYEVDYIYETTGKYP